MFTHLCNFNEFRHVASLCPHRLRAVTSSIIKRIMAPVDGLFHASISILPPCSNSLHRHSPWPINDACELISRRHRKPHQRGDAQSAWQHSENSCWLRRGWNGGGCWKTERSQVVKDKSCGTLGNPELAKTHTFFCCKLYYEMFSYHFNWWNIFSRSFFSSFYVCWMHVITFILMTNYHGRHAPCGHIMDLIKGSAWLGYLLPFGFFPQHLHIHYTHCNAMSQAISISPILRCEITKAT